MAKAGKAHAPEDIWHLSIDDLLAAPKAPEGCTARGPYVINLSTSTASIGRPPKGLRGVDGLHLYQLRRESEGRVQFMLRLGIIATEVEADAILGEVLEHYPGATKDSAQHDDRAAVDAQSLPAEQPTPAQPTAPKPDASEPQARKTPEARRAPPGAALPAPRSTAKPPEPFHWDIDELLPDLAVMRAAQAPTAAQAPASVQAPASAQARVEELDSDPLAITLEVEVSPQATIGQVDSDSRAMTHEVEVPAFVFEPSQSDAPASAAPQLSVRLDEQSTAELQVLEVINDKVPTLDACELDVFTFEAPVPAPDAEAEAVTSESADTEAEAFASLTDEAPPAPAADPGTLEQLVAKIGALVESADAHDKHTTSIQTAANALHTPPERPALRVPSAERADRADLIERPDWIDQAEPSVPSVFAHPAARPSPPHVSAAAPQVAEAPEIDSTQTIRALTRLELEDDQSSQWFSIQLVLSEEHIDPERVPNLDIYNEYRLYSVTGLDRDRVMHALRLGFFSSELAAESVAGYLRGFFDSPCIKRVSLAERERFVEKIVTARKDIGATGMHAVIELTSPTPLPERRIEVSESGKRRAPSSVWSRIVAPLKR